MGNNRVGIQESVVIGYSCGSCCQKFELSGVHNSNKKVQDLIDRLGKEIKDRSDGRDYSSLKAIRYRTQFMLGTNYFIKARTHNGKFIHLRVYVPLDGGRPELYGLRHDMRADQEISYF